MVKKIVLFLIKWYQNTISRSTPPSCRFQPSCSQYTYEAIEKFGVLKGCVMGLWRLIRCNPFNKGGFDPVPNK